MAFLGFLISVFNRIKDNKTNHIKMQRNVFSIKSHILSNNTQQFWKKSKL